MQNADASGDNEVMHAPVNAGHWVGRPTVVDGRGLVSLSAVRTRPSKFRRWTLGGLVTFGIVTVAGCSTMQPINPWHSDAGSPKTAGPSPVLMQSKVENGDPLLRMVGSMPVTVDQSFREPATGEMLRVRVLVSYASASGRTCREYVVITPTADDQHRVVCADGDRWIAVRPLRQETGAAKIQ